jgi:hypothetical protein
MYSPTPNKMPTRITLTYHAYKDFEVPNKIAKMINDGTIQWRSHHDDLFYTDENGKEQCVSSISECVAWEGHDDYEVAESEESDEEEEEKKCEGATFSFACSESCECKNKKENWIHCSKCSNINCDFASDKEEGWTYDDESEKWLCCDCSPEDEDDVKSTCCHECGEGFTFDEPVPYKDYMLGKHEQTCGECLAKDEDEEEDCLAGNPKCVKCKIYLSEDDMAEWTKDTTKEPMCESCLDEGEEFCEKHEQPMWKDGLMCGGCCEESLVEGVDYEVINSGIVMKEENSESK